MEPLNHLHICAAARLAHGDLFEIDRQLTGGHDLNGQWVLLVKQALIAVANLTDLELTVRRIYKEQPEVSAEYKKWQRQFDFAKYVRNILVGHTNPALIEKAIEWKPELYSLLGEDDENARLLINVFLLETAINTYVGDDEKHLVFEEDTDLVYQPDWRRFLGFLGDVVRGGIAFLALLIGVLELPAKPSDAERMEFFKKAGLTTFKRITRGR